MSSESVWVESKNSFAFTSRRHDPISWHGHRTVEAHARFGIIETTDVSYAQEENADLREGLPGPRATCRHRSSTHDAELSGR